MTTMVASCGPDASPSTGRSPLRSLASGSVVGGRLLDARVLHAGLGAASGLAGVACGGAAEVVALDALSAVRRVTLEHDVSEASWSPGDTTSQRAPADTRLR